MPKNYRKKNSSGDILAYALIGIAAVVVITLLVLLFVLGPRSSASGSGVKPGGDCCDSIGYDIVRYK